MYIFILRLPEPYRLQYEICTGEGGGENRNKSRNEIQIFSEGHKPALYRVLTSVKSLVHQKVHVPSITAHLEAHCSWT